MCRAKSAGHKEQPRIKRVRMSGVYSWPNLTYPQRCSPSRVRGRMSLTTLKPVSRFPSSTRSALTPMIRHVIMRPYTFGARGDFPSRTETSFARRCRPSWSDRHRNARPYPEPEVPRAAHRNTSTGVSARFRFDLEYSDPRCQKLGELTLWG